MYPNGIASIEILEFAILQKNEIITENILYIYFKVVEDIPWAVVILKKILIFYYCSLEKHNRWSLTKYKHMNHDNFKTRGSYIVLYKIQLPKRGFRKKKWVSL